MHKVFGLNFEDCVRVHICVRVLVCAFVQTCVCAGARVRACACVCVYVYVCWMIHHKWHRDSTHMCEVKPRATDVG